MSGSRCLLLLLALLPLAPADAAPGLSVRTQDGVRLALDGRGRITQVGVGGRSLPATEAPGGFYFLDYARAKLPKAELVRNGDFSRGTDGWTFGPDWRIFEDPDIYRKGKSAYVEMAGDPRRGSDVSQLVPVEPGTAYHLSLSMRTEGVKGTPPHVWVGMVGADGTTSVAPQVTLSHNRTDSGGQWFPMQEDFTTGTETHFVLLRWGVWQGAGKAWVDDVSLTPVDSPLEPLAKPFSGTARTRDGGIHFEGADAGAGLRLTATLQGMADRIHVEGRLADTSGDDRAVVLWLRLPLKLDAEWKWGHDINHEVPVGPTATLSNTQVVAPGQTMSQYPWAALHDAQDGLALSVPLDQPRVFRLAYSPRYGCYLVLDLGLSKAALKTPQRASFSCDLYRFAPRWGFRSATQRYYQLFPRFFREWPKGHGTWSHEFWDWKAEARPLDYGIRWQVFDYWKNPDVRDDRAAGVITVRYMEPSGYWGWRIGHKAMPVGTPQPPYPELLADLKRRAAEKDPEAQRIEQCGITDAADALRVDNWVPEWGGAHWTANPDPDLPDASGATRNQGTDAWDDCDKHCEGYRLEGAYSDAGPFLWQNFRRDHFAFVDHPLSFDYATRKVCIPPQVSSFEFYQWLDGKLREKGRHLLMHWTGANMPTRLFGIHFGDTLGNEQLWVPMSEDQYVTQRTLCFRRTLHSYMNDARRLPIEQRERFCRQDLAYGFFSDPCHPVLGRLYVSLQRELARAGWEPVTGATAAQAGIHVERFGRAADGSLHFTLRNGTDAGVTATLRLDEAVLGRLDGRLSQVVESQFEALPPQPLAGSSLSVPLPAGSVRLVRIGTPEELAHLWQPEVQRQVEGAARYLGMAAEGTVPPALRSLAGRQDAASLRQALATAVGAAPKDAWIRHAALALAEADRLESTARLAAAGRWASIPEGWPSRPGWPIRLRSAATQEVPAQVVVNAQSTPARLGSVFAQIQAQGSTLVAAPGTPAGLYPAYLEWGSPQGGAPFRLYFDIEVPATR